MPLSELYRIANANTKGTSTQEKDSSCFTDLSFTPENDFVELVWENDHIMMQGQSNRTRKSSQCFPCHTPKRTYKGIENGATATKIREFGTMTSIGDEMGLNQDDDAVPWMNYSNDGSLQHDYCSEFLPELSGVTANEHSMVNNFASFDRSIGCRLIGNSQAVSLSDNCHFGVGNASNKEIARVKEDTKPKSSISRLYPTSFQRTSDNGNRNMSNGVLRANSDASVKVPTTSANSFPVSKLQGKHPEVHNTVSGLVNFSHFKRPAAFFRACAQKNTGASSSLTSVERLRSNDRFSADSNIPAQSLLDSLPVKVPSKTEVAPREANSLQKVHEGENGKKPRQDLGKSIIKAKSDIEKNIEPTFTSSSIGSENNVERASNDTERESKRKCRENGESEGPGEEYEGESAGVKRKASARGGTGSKRSRAAEVHNLSERKRRDRINEKMRALQELIPNCNKVDKASMLDEAIEYLKTLQLQVQIMSMGAGLYISPMMFSPMLPHMHTSHMAPFPSMGVRMGIGMPDLNSLYSASQANQAFLGQVAEFSVPPTPGAPAFPGMPRAPSQEFSMSVPHAPLYVSSGGAITKAPTIVGACGLRDLAAESSSKDLMQNVNDFQKTQNGVSNNSMNQTSRQV